MNLKNQTNKAHIRNMILFFFLIIIFGCQSNAEQNTEQKSLNESKSKEQIEDVKLCMFSTKNNSKSEGINLEMPYPCEWQIDNGQNQNVLQKFRKILTDGSALEELLVISNIGRSLSNEEINILLSEKILNEGMDPSKDRSISFEKIEIDGNPSAKIVYETKLNNLGNEIFSKVAQTCIYHNQCLIRIQQGTFSQTKEKSESLYNDFDNFFTKLTTSIKFHDN